MRPLTKEPKIYQLEKRKLMKNLMLNFWREESGQDLIEYSLLLAFVALASGAILTSLGADLVAIWSSADSKVKVAQGKIT